MELTEIGKSVKWPNGRQSHHEDESEAWEVGWLCDSHTCMVSVPNE